MPKTYKPEIRRVLSKEDEAMLILMGYTPTACSLGAYGKLEITPISEGANHLITHWNAPGTDIEMPDKLILKLLGRL